MPVQPPLALEAGGGVITGSPVRVVDDMVERRLTEATTLAGEASARADSVSVLDQVFSEMEGSIGSALRRFEEALAGFAQAPSERSPRTLLLAAAEQVTTAFNAAGQAVDDARADANSAIVREVQHVNARLEEIAGLNVRVADALGSGQEAGSLLDHRDMLIREVGERMPVSVVEHDSGAVTLMLDGSRILVGPGGEHRELTTGVNGDGNRYVIARNGSVEEDVTSFIDSGKVFGYMDARDGSLADVEALVDELAYDTVNAYNSVHQAGYGLDGSTGRNLFIPLAQIPGAAVQMELSSDVAGQPDNVAGAQAVGLAGDNRNALALQEVAENPVASGLSRTLGEAYASLVGVAGTAVESANYASNHATSALEQTQSMRDSLSGVSSDEELVNLVKYQRAYQASMRVVQTADSLLEELLNMR